MYNYERQVLFVYIYFWAWLTWQLLYSFRWVSSYVTAVMLSSSSMSVSVNGHFKRVLDSIRWQIDLQRFNWTPQQLTSWPVDQPSSRPVDQPAYNIIILAFQGGPGPKANRAKCERVLDNGMCPYADPSFSPRQLIKIACSVGAENRRRLPLWQ